MLQAEYNGLKYRAEESEIGFCPECREEVIRVLGDVYVKHWRHQGNSGCDYGVGETQWHLFMKSLFPKECVEITHNGVRSDVMLPGGTVIEFQNSPIEPLDVMKRILASSNRIVWVFNLKEQYDREQIILSEDHYEYRRPKSIFTSCLPNLYWYCTQDTIAEPESFNLEYIENEKSGYRDKWYSGSAWIMSIERFVHNVTRKDKLNQIYPTLI